MLFSHLLSLSCNSLARFPYQNSAWISCLSILPTPHILALEGIVKNDETNPNISRRSELSVAALTALWKDNLCIPPEDGAETCCDQK
jgi:hypothetical protein